jgi:Ca-activated chloride channel family protein
LVHPVNSASRPQFTKILRRLLRTGTAALAFLPAAALSQEETATFKVSAGLVTLNVSVKDRAGVPVRGLQKSDFTVREDGKPQEIVFFGQENTPSSIVLLLDVSSSMEGEQLQEAMRAANEFIELARAEDETALIAFNDKVTPLAGFTSDKETLKRRILELRAAGGTALYDAISHGTETLRSARHQRHVLVLFSDGIDADSRRRFADVERLVQASNAVLFAVGEYVGKERKSFMTGSRYYKEPALEVNYNPVWILKQLSEVTGGSAFFPEPGQPLAPVFNRIARELRDQYVLGYAPPAPGDDPRWRSIEVRIDGADVRGYTVRTRKGYLSPGITQSTNQTNNRN